MMCWGWGLTVNRQAPFSATCASTSGCTHSNDAAGYIPEVSIRATGTPDLQPAAQPQQNFFKFCQNAHQPQCGEQRSLTNLKAYTLPI